ncbi:hypothetical protein JXL19_02370 [bacterium]|nr:hypothetical protein [bacterium]
MITNAGMRVINLYPEDMKFIIKAAQSFNLDFDDAYQYAISEKYDLIIMSFEPRQLGKILLSKTGVTLPDAIPCRNVEAVTRKKCSLSEILNDYKMLCHKNNRIFDGRLD